MGSFCKSGPATSITQGNTSSTYTPAGRQGFEDIWNRVKEAGSTPYSPYTGALVADLNPTQWGGINNITGATGYLDRARDYATSGAAPITEDQIGRYLNPFTKNVVNATQANFNESNAQQQNQVVGNAALKGALGGNRVGVAQAELARQQKLAQDPVIANLNQQGFNLALAGAQQDRAAQAQAGSQFGALGNAAIGQGQAQIGAGSLAQGVDQAKLNAAYQEFMRQQQFPYQQAQFLAQTGIPALSGQGGTQSGTSYSQQQQYAAQPSPLQMGLGLATTAAGLFTGNPMAAAGGLGSLGSMFGTGYTGGGGGGWGANPWSMNSYGFPNVQTAGLNFNRGGRVPGFKHGGFVDTVRALRHSFRYGGGIPGYASGGTMMNGERIYSPDELSPLDPPYADFPGRARDRDDAIRTILSEAGNQGPTGEQAVANVIRNRAVQGGFGGDNPSDVVRKPFQFEPWNTAEGRAKMAGYDPNSPEYRAAGAALDKAYTGDDPTKGATHFYSPGAQAALGRSAPSWDNGTGKDIGDHRFFGGIPGPGDGGASELTAQRRGFGSGAAGYTSPFGGRMPSVGPDDSGRNALITAGLGILASRAPNAFQAIGEGGLLGMKQYTTGKETRQKNELAAYKLMRDAEQFAQGHDLRERTLRETTRYHNLLDDQRRDAMESRKEIAQQQAQERRERTGYMRNEDGTWSPIKGGPADPEQIAAINKAKRTGEALPEATADFLAERVIAGDSRALIGLGRGAQGAENIAKIQSLVAQKAQNQGMNAQDLLAKVAEQSGLTAQQRTFGTQVARMAVNATEAQGAIELGREASAAVPRTSWVPVNKAIQAYQSNTSDPNLAKFGAANLAIVNTYARAISPSGVPTVHDKEHAEKLLSTATSHESYMGLLDQLNKEIEIAHAAPLKAKKEMEAIRKAPASDTGHGAAPGAPAPQQNAIPQRPSQVPAGSQYSPSRKLWRDPSGVIYNERGEKVQ